VRCIEPQPERKMNRSAKARYRDRLGSRAVLRRALEKTEAIGLRIDDLLPSRLGHRFQH
jgi:hypothetical protein